MLGPTAVEAVPFDPYADAQGCDISGRSPAAGGGPPLPASAHLTWMQSENTVSITHGRHVLRADATKQQAVAYAINGFCGKAVDRGEIEFGDAVYDGEKISRCLIYTGTEGLDADGCPTVTPPGTVCGTLVYWVLLLRSETRVGWADMLQDGIQPHASNRCHNKKCINPAHASADEQALYLSREICRPLQCRLLTGLQITCPCFHPRTRGEMHAAAGASRQPAMSIEATDKTP